MPIKPGSPTVPVPGYQVEVLDDQGRPLPPGQVGAICLKLPLPPGTLPTLWGDDDRYVASYLSAYDGYYLSGDGGYLDEDGYLYVMGRTDDVINVAGHRGDARELLGQRDGGLGDVVPERAVRRHLAHLRGRRLGELRAAVTHVGEPQSRGRVEVAVAVGVVDVGALTAGDDELAVPLDGPHVGERMPQRAHVPAPLLSRRMPRS
jgi:hypothetical protein